MNLKLNILVSVTMLMALPLHAEEKSVATIEATLKENSVVIAITVTEGFYMYAQQDIKPEGTFGRYASLQLPEEIAFGDIQWPEARSHDNPYSDVDDMVWEGVVEITIPFAGEWVEGTTFGFSGQACDPMSCHMYDLELEPTS